MYGYIYKITHKDSNKIYIGKHKYDKPELDESYICSGVYINKAINKYGLDSFVIEIVDIAQSLEELNNKEKHYIAYYNCRYPKGYNLTSGGDGCSDPDEDTRYKMGSNWRGKKQSKDMCEKRNNALKNVIHTDAWKLKISEANKNSLKNLEGLKKACNIHAQLYTNSCWYTNGEIELKVKFNEQPPKGFINMRLRKYKHLKFLLDSINRDEFTNYYANHSTSMTKEYYHLNDADIDYLITTFNLDKHSKAENIELTNLSKYGCKNVMNNEAIYNKHKQKINKKV